MTESIAPPKKPEPEIRYQPSMLSVPTAASTVRPSELPAPSTAKSQRGARRKLWFFATLAAVGGVIAASKLGGASHVSSDVRSGSPGYRKSKSGQTLHWHKNALTIYLDHSLTKLGPNATHAVTQAFGQWVESDARLPDLSFDTGKTTAVPTRDGKSTISYGRISAPGHERDLAITLTHADDDTGEIVEADIVLNSMYPIGVLTSKSKGQEQGQGHGSRQNDSGNGKSMNAGEADDCQNRYDVQNVATHEAGHFFGLGEDQVERDAAMFQTIDQCETHKRVLSRTDVSAVSTLYAETEDPEEVAAGARACSFVVARDSGALGWISGLILGMGLLARRRSALPRASADSAH